MKLALSSFFIFFIFFLTPVCGEGFYKTYTIKVSGIKIGKLEWGFEISKKNYSNKLKLKSEGILSGLYTFSGEYFSEGVVKNKTLTPNTYTHLWKTNKTNKSMSLVFNSNKLKSLEQTPAEKEYLRIDVFKLEKTKDPLTSFLQIIMGSNN